MKLYKISVFFILSAVVLLFYKCTSRPQPSTIVTLNTIIADSVPFKTIFRWAWFDSTKSLHLDGIDSLAMYTLYLEDLGEATHIGAPSPIKDHIIYVSGVSKKNHKRVVLLDTNNDGSIAGETPYFLDENPPYIPINNVQYKEGDSIRTATFFVKPYIDRGMMEVGGHKKHYPHIIGNIGALIRPAYHYGIFKTEEGSYKLALFNYYQNNYTPQTAFLSVVPAKSSFPSPSASPLYYQQEDVFYLGKKGYRFKGMSKDGNKVTLEQLDDSKKNVGADSGLYAIPIQGIDIRTGEKYDLSSAKHYTILDFWGTWCGPCLKLMPNLQALNLESEKYKFRLISIAYDDNPKAVSNHIQKEGIYWTNLFDDRNNSMITDKYKVGLFPTFILIDKEGKILYRGAGKDALEQIEKIVKAKQ